MPVPYTQVFRTTVSQSLWGIRVVNVWHYGCNTFVGGGTDESDLNTYVEGSVLDKYALALSSSWRVECISTSRVGMGGNPPAELFPDPVIVGAQQPEAMPTSSVVVTTEYTNALDRSSRGRHFISGFLLAHEGDNALIDAAYTLFGNLAVAISSHPGALPGGGTYERILLSGNPAFANTVINTVPHPQIRKMRGRTERRC